MPAQKRNANLYGESLLRHSVYSDFFREKKLWLYRLYLSQSVLCLFSSAYRKRNGSNDNAPGGALSRCLRNTQKLFRISKLHSRITRKNPVSIAETGFLNIAQSTKSNSRSYMETVSPSLMPSSRILSMTPFSRDRKSVV